MKMIIFCVVAMLACFALGYWLSGIPYSECKRCQEHGGAIIWAGCWFALWAFLLIFVTSISSQGGT